MIHYCTTHKVYVLLGVGLSLSCYSLVTLQEQAKKLYNFDILTLLN